MTDAPFRAGASGIPDGEPPASAFRRVPSDAPRGLAPPVIVVSGFDGALAPADHPEADRLSPALAASGLDVFVPDWRAMRARPGSWDLGRCLLGDLGACVASVAGRSGGRRPALLGIGEAGLATLCYAALRPDEVAAVALLSVPVDFAAWGGGEIPAFGWHEGADAAEIDRFVTLAGQLAEGPAAPFPRLDLPLGQLAFRQAWGSGHGRAPFDARTTPLARDWLHAFHRRNALVTGGLTVDGEPVDLRRVTAPVLTIYGEDERLVPAAASRAAGHVVGSEHYAEWTLPHAAAGLLGRGDGRERIAAHIAEWLVGLPSE